MTKKTLSFVKGKGSIRHNNRTFIADNVDRRRLPMNIYFRQESLEEAYQKSFGEAVAEYNAKQTRADRKKGDYLTEIKNSRNKEKQFYETVVQIGKMDDTSVIGADGVLTHDAAEAAKILVRYMETFQERNPNLYLFNAVLHMDEATPHLHLDYIPVATGYKSGMKKRNSLTKALQNMGFAKGKGKKDNETIYWQKREREYLTDLCKERGIEIEVLGIDRPSLSLPEYREAIHEAVEIREENRVLNSENQELTDFNTALRKDNDELTENMQRAMLEAQKILEDMDMEQEEQQIQIDQNKIELRKQELESGTSKAVEREVAALVGQAKSQAVVSNGLFETETYVKVPRKLWKQILQAYEWGMKQSKMVDKLTEQNALIMEKLEGLKAFKKKAMEFLGIQGLTEGFHEFLHPKKESIKDNLKRVGQKSQQKQEMNEQAATDRKRHQEVL